MHNKLNYICIQEILFENLYYTTKDILLLLKKYDLSLINMYCTCASIQSRYFCKN